MSGLSKKAAPAQTSSSGAGYRTHISKGPSTAGKRVRCTAPSVEQCPNNDAGPHITFHDKESFDAWRVLEPVYEQGMAILQYHEGEVDAEALSSARWITGIDKGVGITPKDLESGKPMTVKHAKFLVDQVKDDFAIAEQQITEAESGDGRRGLGKGGAVTPNNSGNSDWVTTAKHDISQWRDAFPSDWDGNAMDWDFVSGLDLQHGVGVGADYPDPVEGYARDGETQSKLHFMCKAMENAFLYDRRCRSIDSFRLARAMSYANKRLTDEMTALRRRAESDGLEVPKRQIVAESERRAAERKKLSGMMSREERDEKAAKRHAKDIKYIPGPDIDRLTVIDIETSGGEDALGQPAPDLNWVVDYGTYEVNVGGFLSDDSKTIADDPEGGHAESIGYGTSDQRIRLGNNWEELTHISADRFRESKPLDEDPEAQRHILENIKRNGGFLAHNAKFEQGHFMYNVEGFAEGLRSGEITTYDSMMLSRHCDPRRLKRVSPDAYGNSAAAGYKRWGVSDVENHNGADDARMSAIYVCRLMKFLKKTGSGMYAEDSEIKGRGGFRYRVGPDA